MFLARRLYKLPLLPVRCFSMTLEEVESTVFEVIKRFDKVDPAKVSRASTFEELGLDSLDAVETVVAMEEKFGVDLEDGEAMKVVSVKDAVTVFHKHKAK